MVKRTKMTQRGFTLVEVALALALGIIIVIGAILGFASVRDAQSERESRNRLGSMKAIIEQHGASNNGTTPTEAQLRAIWSERRRNNAGNSPWGGVALPNAAGDVGISEYALSNIPTQVVAGNAGGVGYSRTVTAAGEVIVFDRASSSTVTFKDYAIFYFDKAGRGPWFVTGGE